jgi:hypothetical protein
MYDSPVQHSHLTMYYFNQGRVYAHVVRQSDNRFVVCVTNPSLQVTLEVSEPFQSADRADWRAQRYAGVPFPPIDPDEYEEYLSRRLDF